MRKILTLLAIFGATSVFAVDSYIYWMANVVDENEKQFTGTYTASVMWKENETSTAQALMSYYGDVNLSEAGESIGSDLIKTYTQYDGMGLYAKLTKETGSFYIEVTCDGYADSFASDALTYQQALSSMYIAQSDIGTAESALWLADVVVNTSAPEPSSAVLMMLGCALLGLRRKRKLA